jgi:small subunit ribosomal protein S6
MIVDPDVSEGDRDSLFDRIKEIIPQQKGVLIKEDPWGNKKLAYEVKKKPRGYYVRYDYCGMGPVVDEIERFFKIDDRVLKYLTVQLAEEADAEKILAEMTEEKAAADTETPETEGPPETPETPPETSEAPAQAEATEPVTETSEKE